ncbi:hypothetical protein Hanom_Chr06g00565171 [Helianthus anomalus]
MMGTHLLCIMCQGIPKRVITRCLTSAILLIHTVKYRYWFTSLIFFPYIVLEGFLSTCTPNETVDGSSGSDRNNSEPERQRTKAVVSKKVAPSRPAPQSRPAMVASGSTSAPQNVHSLCKLCFFSSYT